MKTEILMPSLSPTMEEGSLAKWYVSPGDKVKPGDIIADIETNKLVIISEFRSPINFPKKPDIIEAIKGKAIIEISILPF